MSLKSQWNENLSPKWVQVYFIKKNHQLYLQHIMYDRSKRESQTRRSIAVEKAMNMKIKGVRQWMLELFAIIYVMYLKLDNAFDKKRTLKLIKS